MTTSTASQSCCLTRALWKRGVAVLILLIIVGTGAGSTVNFAVAQSDSDNYRSPRGALIRSVIVPGWGQLYNGHYYKIPIVYAGLGSLAYIVAGTNSEYKLYRHAFQYKAWEETIGEDEPNPVAEFESDYLRLLAREGLNEISASSLEPARDRLRRNRDFAILGIGIVYGLATLDAYVSAHLLDFDIGDDLSLSILPHGTGVRVNLHLE